MVIRIGWQEMGGGVVGQNEEEEEEEVYVCF